MTLKLTHSYDTKYRMMKTWENYPADGDFCPACQNKLSKVTGPMRELFEGSTGEFKLARCETCRADARICLYDGKTDFVLKREDGI